MTAKKIRAESEASGGVPVPVEKTSVKTVLIWVGAMVVFNLLLIWFNYGINLIGNGDAAAGYILSHAVIQALILVIFLPGKRMKTGQLVSLMALCNGLWAFSIYERDGYWGNWDDNGPAGMPWAIIAILALLGSQIYLIWKYKKNADRKWLIIAAVSIALLVLFLKPWLFIESVWEKAITHRAFFDYCTYLIWLLAF